VAVNHTSTHLLHYALRQVVGQDVKQAGSFVGDERLRFDFVCFSEVSTEMLDKVEEVIQEKIFRDDKVAVKETSLQEAVDSGAIALFTEKYGERVRVIKSGDYHAEVCGGTHIDRTGRIFVFKITDFSSVGRNLKRIEAVTYRKALQFLNEKASVLNKAGQILEIEPGKITGRIEKILSENREKNKKLQQYENRFIEDISKRLSKEKEILHYNRQEMHFIGRQVNLESKESVSNLADNLVEKDEKIFVVLGSEIKNKIFIVIKLSDKIQEYFSAGKLMKEITGLIEGGGGGNPGFAQGSGKNKGSFASAVKKIKEIIEKND
jgi:alanyl-tRNA synthetase